MNLTGLEKEILYFKNKTNINELKWNNFKNQFNTNKTHFETFIQGLKQLEIKIFITISKPQHFQMKKSEYNIIKTIKGLDNNIFTGKNITPTLTRSRILSAVENVLFFCIYEKIHIENSIKALCNKDNLSDYIYKVDSPQTNSEVWQAIAKNLNIQQIKIIKDSSKDPGIEIADIVAGCIQDLIKGNKQAKVFYASFVQQKMRDMHSTGTPNPNLIFFDDFTKDERDKLNIFRRPFASV